MNASLLVKALALVALLSSLAFAESEMVKALDDYYKYSKEENLDAYYSAQDLSELSPNAQVARKEVTKTVWERFDTLSYALSDVRETEKGDFGIIEYRIAAKIRGPDGTGAQKELSFEEDMIAVMHKIDGKWRVNQVQQLDIFYANMENFYLDAQTGVIDDINEKAVEKIEAQPPGEVKGPEGKCTGDADCPPGQKCSSGACVVPKGCKTDADCPKGLACRGLSCTVPEPPCPIFILPLAVLGLAFLAGRRSA